MCVFLGLCSGVAEGSIFIGCDAPSLDNRIPTFRENAEFSFSRVVMSKKNICMIRSHEDEDSTLSQREQHRIAEE